MRIAIRGRARARVYTIGIHRDLHDRILSILLAAQGNRHAAIGSNGNVRVRREPREYGKLSNVRTRLTRVRRNIYDHNRQKRPIIRPCVHLESANCLFRNIRCVSDDISYSVAVIGGCRCKTTLVAEKCMDIGSPDVKFAFFFFAITF